MGAKYFETRGIGNYYGSLRVKEEDGNYYWSITNWDGDHWEQITKGLADMLIQRGNMKECNPEDDY